MKEKKKEKEQGKKDEITATSEQRGNNLVALRQRAKCKTPTAARKAEPPRLVFQKIQPSVNATVETLILMISSRCFEGAVVPTGAGCHPSKLIEYTIKQLQSPWWTI